jgi:SSS family solute:Na+ symporter
VSLSTKPKADVELKGLVYGLTEIPRDEVAWYKRPVPLAIIVSVALVVLNLLFW